MDQGRLLDYIVSWGNLTEEKVACYLRDVLEALHYLHNCRIAHLDVKVSAIILFIFLLDLIWADIRPRIAEIYSNLYDKCEFNSPLS